MQDYGDHGIDALIQNAKSRLQKNDTTQKQKVEGVAALLYRDFYRRNRQTARSTYLLASRIGNVEAALAPLKPVEGWRGEEELVNSNIVFKHGNDSFWEGSRLSLQLNVGVNDTGASLAQAICLWLDNFYFHEGGPKFHWKFPVPGNIGGSLEDVVVYFETTLSGSQMAFLLQTAAQFGVPLDQQTSIDIHGMVKAGNGAYYAKQPNVHKMLRDHGALWRKVEMFSDYGRSHGKCVCHCVAATVLMLNDMNLSQAQYLNGSRALFRRMMDLTHEDAPGDKVIRRSHYVK